MNEEQKQNEELKTIAPAMGRRRLLKMGVGVAVAAATNMLHAQDKSGQAAQEKAPNAAAQDSPEEAARLASVRDGASKPVPGGPPYLTPHSPQHRVAKYGDFMNTSGRLYGNGPMDETSHRIVDRNRFHPCRCSSCQRKSCRITQEHRLGIWRDNDA